MSKDRVTAQVTASWSGPLPSPESIQRFNEIIPNGAERIMAMTEKQSDHRISYERRGLTIEAVERIGSRILAFVFAISALGVAAYCASIGQAWPAAVIGGGTIVGVVTALVYTNRPKP